MISRSKSLVTKGTKVGLDEETISTSHFEGLRTRVFSATELCTIIYCCCSVAKELVTVCISSA